LRRSPQIHARLVCVAGVTVALAAALGGCAGHHSSGPYAPQSEAQRDSLKAQRLTQEAAAVLDKDPSKAERLLREALSADLYHGPAHNDLGVVYLKQGKLYEAAGEFEWARKLLPGHPDPRVNLALVLERAGRVDEAITGYRSALEVYPEYLPAVQGLAPAQGRPRRRAHARAPGRHRPPRRDPALARVGPGRAGQAPGQIAPSGTAGCSALARTR
jgi:tetratricopeptide (TPR) repeat protein